MLKIYNTLTKKKEEFKPLNPGEVKIYTCGITVYDDCHIGHGRSLYIFEVIRRYFKFRGFKVKFVRNITDIDDKILNKAKELTQKKSLTIEEAWRKVVDNYTQSYYQDLEALKINKADVEPCASSHIPQIIDFVKVLLERGFAYQRGGSVYFRVREYQRKFLSYGELSGKNIDELLNFVRIEPDFHKEDPLDFALWKEKKEGEVSWPSPWGEGRPGWHIECSVMAINYLGETFDIHGGGRDLVFPHHENEIAQAKAKTSQDFAHYWLHHGLITVNKEKMSKSLGNFLTLRNAIKRYSSDVLKIFYLSSHYRNNLDFSEEKIKEAQRVKDRILIFTEQLRLYSIKGTLKFSYPQVEELYQKFINFMDDDFNMPKGFSLIFDLIELVNKNLNEAPDFFSEVKTLLFKILEIFAIFPEERQLPPQFLNYIEEKVKERIQLRKAKKFAQADRIRKELLEKGIVLEDLPSGQTRWRAL
ncbi:MAG: cysteine--tRNA ligase [Candidatus Omnitrophica bacterium]|nr:cysteine--tRNA ligase [Candidatus Omnitrophota bacterium]